jgi:hypothetical protein
LKNFNYILIRYLKHGHYSVIYEVKSIKYTNLRVSKTLCLYLYIEVEVIRGGIIVTAVRPEVATTVLAHEYNAASEPCLTWFLLGILLISYTKYDDFCDG